MVKGKGQTRSWLIIVPLPAGEKYRKKIKLIQIKVIVKIMTTMLILYTFSAEPRTCTIQLIKRILNKGAEGQEQRCLPISLI
jgi:hypothetical protein